MKTQFFLLGIVLVSFAIWTQISIEAGAESFMELPNGQTVIDGLTYSRNSTNEIKSPNSLRDIFTVDTNYIKPSLSDYKINLKFVLLHQKPTSASIVPQTSNDLTYKNYDRGIMVRYPCGWMFEDIGRVSADKRYVSVVTFRIAENLSENNNLPQVDIKIDNSPLHQNLGSYMTQRSGTYSNSSRDVSIETNSTRTSSFLAGHPAYNLLVKQYIPELGQYILSMEIGTLVGNKGYIITYSAPSDSYNQYLTGAEEIVRSFRLMGHPL